MSSMLLKIRLFFKHCAERFADFWHRLFSKPPKKAPTVPPVPGLLIHTSPILSSTEPGHEYSATHLGRWAQEESIMVCSNPKDPSFYPVRQKVPEPQTQAYRAYFKALVGVQTQPLQKSRSCTFFLKVHGFKANSKMRIPLNKKLHFYTLGDLSTPFIGSTFGMASSLLYGLMTRLGFIAARSDGQPWHAYVPSPETPDLTLCRMLAEKLSAYEELSALAKPLLNQAIWSVVGPQQPQTAAPFDFTSHTEFGDPNAILVLEGNRVLKGKSLFHYLCHAYEDPKACVQRFGTPILFISPTLSVIAVLCNQLRLSFVLQTLEKYYPDCNMDIFTDACNAASTGQHSIHGCAPILARPMLFESSPFPYYVDQRAVARLSLEDRAVFEARRAAAYTGLAQGERHHTCDFVPLRQAKSQAVEHFPQPSASCARSRRFSVAH